MCVYFHIRCYYVLYTYVVYITTKYNFYLQILCILKTPMWLINMRAQSITIDW